jgi:hypothetical protein
MTNYDVATETNLPLLSEAEFLTEIQSYGNAKRALLTYLKEQFSARVLLRNGIYNSIPQNSKYRMHKKPFKLCMEPRKPVGEKITTKDKVQYLTSLLQIMMAEDLGRINEPNVEVEDTGLVRRFSTFNAFSQPLVYSP